MPAKPLAKKITSIVLNVLMYLFLAICLVAILLSITSKKDVDGASRILGYEMRYIRSDSMTKSPHTDISDYKIKDLPIKTLVIVQTVPEDPEKANKWYAKLKKGDVLTFRYSATGLTQETITHRLIEDPVPNKNGGYDLVLQGDNKGKEEKPIELGKQTIDTTDYEAGGYNYVIGKVVGSSYAFGLLVYAVKQPLGIVFIIIVPCVIIIILEIIRIMQVLNEEKAKKAKEEKVRQDGEIEELKKQLAALQQGLAAQQAPPVAPVPVPAEGEKAAEQVAPAEEAQVAEKETESDSTAKEPSSVEEEK